MGSCALALERRPGRDGHLTLPPVPLQNSWVCLEKCLRKEQSRLQICLGSSDLTDSFSTKERTAQAFFSLYFKLSVFHASFGLKCVGCFFAFNPFPPHLSLNVSVRVPSPPDVCCDWAIPSTILLSSFSPRCLSVMDGFSGFWKLGPPQRWGGCGGGVGSGTHGGSLGCP